MNIMDKFSQLDASDYFLRKKWDEFVFQHPHGTVSHLSGWMDVIHEAYNRLHVLSLQRFKPLLPLSFYTL